MGKATRKEIEAAKDAALLCLDGARYVKVLMWFGWAPAKNGSAEELREFGEHAEKYIAQLESCHRRAEELTSNDVRQAITEANVDNPAVEWFGNRYATAHDAAIYIAQSVVAYARIHEENSDERERWNLTEAELRALPPWDVEFADIERDAAKALRFLSPKTEEFEKGPVPGNDEWASKKDLAEICFLYKGKNPDRELAGREGKTIRIDSKNARAHRLFFRTQDDYANANKRWIEAHRE